MRKATPTLAALLVLGAAAAAQEPMPPAPPKPAEGGAIPAKPEGAAKPAKHENKISAEAKAAWVAMQKATYDPVAAGLKELKGKLVMKVEMPGMEEMEGMEDMMKMAFDVSFKAPFEVKSSFVTDNPMLEAQGDQTNGMVEMFLKHSMGVYGPSPEDELDADVVTAEGGKKTLVITNYEKGEAQGKMKVDIGANGLPGKGVMTVENPMMGGEVDIAMEMVFEKEGELHRLSKFIINRPGMEEPMVFALAWGDGGGFKVMTGISAEIATPMGSAKLNFGYETLSVNGKAVDLPKKAKKEEGTKTETPPAMPPAPPAPPAGEGGGPK